MIGRIHFASYLCRPRMDSLTQIILGAATGEVVLGKKIGNRAMLWGAVGGTLPDMDVLGKFFLSNIDNLAFHRGISHSILFSVIAAVLLGWIVHKLYRSPHHKWVAIISKSLASILVCFAASYVFKIFMPGNYIPTIIFSILMVFVLIWTSKKKYFEGKWEMPDATLRNWQWLFFWSLFTHPILDCFTMYGTQLFAPFSNMRVAWSTISVVDPGYTAPFLICLVVAAFYNRKNNARQYWNYAGIALSSAYLLFTVYNKQRMNTAFEKALVKEEIPYIRYQAGPGILQNILWNCTVETDEHFYLGQRSFFDEVPIKFNRIDKNHDQLEGINTDRTVKVLRWFSNEYFNIIKLEDGYQFNDLRFGTFRGEATSKDDYIFRFNLKDNGSGEYQMEESAGPPKGGAGSLFKELMGRVKGLKK